MKALKTIILIVSLLPASGQLVIPSDGTDGVFNPTEDIVIDLSLAQTAVWSTPVPSPSQGTGTYDENQWAVVFKYVSVNIPSGVTVTFQNHPSYAPVVWLVQGSVTIDGTVSVNGADAASGVSALVPSEPGPGGFRGGAVGPAGQGAGLGPSGGNFRGGAGAFATSYGNPQIIPLIGGSGGGGAERSASNYQSGSAGGGAILIAAATTLQIDGQVTAIPGSVLFAGGSGGAVRLIADQITGSGTIDATGPGGRNGRTRIESNSLNPSLNISPSTISVPPGVSPTIFPSPTAPTVRIVSVDGAPSPLDPTAPLVSSADIAIEKNDPVTVVIETRNFAISGAVVSVRRANKFGGVTTTNATFVSGDSTQALWEASLTFDPGFATLQARATAP